MSNLNETLNPFGKFCMTIGHLPSSYMLSLSYEEQVLWFCEFLEKKIIPAIDNNAEAVKEIQDFLKTLDLQDEVNNKLDEMAESGELESLIAVYLQSNAIISFDTVQDMINSELLVDGSTVRTLGYYEINDGGGATYKIVNDPALNTDNSFVILLQNDLKAKLIYNSEVSILQLGARSQKNNTRYDIRDYVLKYIEKNETDKRKFTLKIPAGIYYTTPILINSENFKIIGESTNTGKVLKTVISAMTNQDYIIKLGDFTKGSGYNTIEGITFASALFDDNYNRTSYFNIYNACLVLSYTYFITANYLAFEYIKGSALNINNSWEIWFNKLDFSHINAFGSGIFVFDEVNTDIQSGLANISDSNFDYLRFEQIIGDCILFKENCKVLNLHFGTINVEPSQVTDMGISWNEYIENSGLSIEQINCVLAIEGQSTFIVDNIQLNNLWHRYYTVDNKNYIFGDVVQLRNSYMIYQIILNSIALYVAKNNVALIRSVGDVYDNPRSKFVINNIANNSVYNMILPIKEVAKLQLKSPLSGISSTNNYITKNGSMIPAYQNNYTYDTQLRGLISYDEKAVNPEKLVIKNNPNLTGVGKRLFGFIFNSLQLNLRIKIPNGVSVDFGVYCYNPDTNAFSGIGNATLEGTGDFARYTVTLNNLTKLYGSIAYFQITDNNLNTEIEVDSFSN